MKNRFLFFLLAALFTLPSLACNFCSSRPKPLSGDAGGLTQDPGSPGAANQNSGGNSNAPQEAVRRGGSSFSYDLKNYKANGQGSSDPNWNSAIEPNNR